MGSFDQLTLVRLKRAAAFFNSFSATFSVDCVVSFNDSSELQVTLSYQFENQMKIKLKLQYHLNL